MTVLRQYQYRDPAEVMEYEERFTCKGCKYKGKLLGRDFCEHPKRTGSAERRCKQYKTKERD